MRNHDDVYYGYMVRVLNALQNQLMPVLVSVNNYINGSILAPTLRELQLEVIGLGNNIDGFKKFLPLIQEIAARHSGPLQMCNNSMDHINVQYVSFRNL